MAGFKKSLTRINGSEFAAATAVLVVSGYLLLGWYLTSDWDLPLGFVVRLAYPWALPSLVVAAVAATLFERGYRRVGLGVAALAVASPIGAGATFFASFSAPYAG